ncbi:MAG TPA: hypothetical protein VKU38_18360 [Ktedonobacteraceae bacterium]|nr:hypothetical protein [Ktedonobacteraceae bacterium]
MVVIPMKNGDEIAWKDFRQSPQEKVRFLLRTITAILAMCTLGSTLLLLAACSTQNNIVNPSSGIWKIVHSANPGSAQNYLSAVAATSATDAWAVGSFSSKHLGFQGTKALIEHWNGTSWSVMPNPNVGKPGNFPSAIAAVSTNDVWIVGNTITDNSVTNTLIQHWDGKVWSNVKGQNPGKELNVLGGVVALSAHDVWAVGSLSNSFDNPQAQPLIEHWNGTAWSTVASPNIGTNNTTLDDAILVPHSTRIWAVGTGATYGAPINVTPTTAGGITQETPVTAQTLIESCCS